MQIMLQSAQTEFEKWSAAWNAGNLEGYLVGYWDSAKTRYISNGEITLGKDNIVAMYRTRFADAKSMGNLHLKHFEIEAAGQHDVMIFGAFNYTLDKHTSDGVFTLHLRQVGDNWQIITDHTSSK